MQKLFLSSKEEIVLYRAQNGEYIASVISFTV